MKKNEAFPSTFLGKTDVEQPIRATIATVSSESIKGEHGPENKPVLHFIGTIKPMIINFGNWDTLETAYGEDSDFWKGKQVEIYVDPNVIFGKKKVGGLRVRIPNGSSNGHSSSPVVLALADAVKRCEEVGISKAQLGAMLKARGNTDYVGNRDTAAVLEMIGQARQAKAEPLGESLGDADEGPRTKEDLPF